MSDGQIRVRANKRTGELEIEGSPEAVAEWWDRLWPEMGQIGGEEQGHPGGGKRNLNNNGGTNGEMPEFFGEFYSEFRSDVTDVDKVLVAAAFVQSGDQERVFTTKAVNQALLDQNVKITNPSQCVRRLIDTKRAFVVPGGKYRVSASGFEHLNSLKVNS